MSTQVEVAFSVASAGNSPMVTPVTAASPLPVSGGVANGSSGNPAPLVVAGRDGGGVLRTLTTDGSGNVITSPVAFTPVVFGAGALIGSGALKAAAGNLYGLNVFSSAAGFLLLYDLTAPPIDGATNAALKKVIQVAAAQALELDYLSALRFAVGISFVFSSTAPLVQTTSATAFVSGQIA